MKALRYWISSLSFVAVLYFFAYSLSSFETAACVMGILAAHELGHYFAAKQKLIKSSVPIFTPFGGVIALLEEPKSAGDEAYMAFGGPVIGLIGTIITLAAGQYFGYPSLEKASQFAFMFHLLNLIPFAPLDGGRISMSISRHLFWLGMPLVALFFWMMPHTTLNLCVAALVAFGGLYDAKMRAAKAEVMPLYYAIPWQQRLVNLSVYIVMAALSFYGAFHTHELGQFLSKLVMRG